MMEVERFRLHILHFYRLPLPSSPQSLTLRMMALQRASTRRTQGLHKLLDVAEELSLDIAIVIMEQLTYREQIQRWSQTDVLIAPTGAALVNLVIMPPGAHWIEVPLQGDHIVGCFYRTHAEDLQIKHHALCGTHCRDIKLNPLCESHMMIEIYREVVYRTVQIQSCHFTQLKKILRAIQANRPLLPNARNDEQCVHAIEQEEALTSDAQPGIDFKFEVQAMQV